jgi:molybdenum cofactor cytidylyltransferase
MSEVPVSRRTDRFVSGLVVAAGARLRPLRRVVDTARACRFDQLLVTVGAGAATAAGLDFAGADVVVDGGPTALLTAFSHLDPRADLLVMLRGDQPGVTPAAVQTLVDGMGLAAVAASGYASGLGHPLAFARDAFVELSAADGDAGVWRMLDRHAEAVVSVPMSRPRLAEAWAPRV